VIGWLLLGGAIGSEVVATVALRMSDGFTKLTPAAVVVLGYAASFWLLALVIKQLPLAITYAVWAGVGTMLVAVAGALFFSERLGAVGLVLVIAGVVLLNVGAAH
jgi:small multidrug resistance pump